MAQTLYCEKPDVYYVLSEDGARVHAEDELELPSGWNDVSEAHVDQAIQYGSARVSMHLLERYKAADLINSTYEGSHIIRCCCAVLSACSLVARGGNAVAAGLKDQCEYWDTWLKKVQAFALTVPGMPEASRSVPTVENYRIVPGLMQPVRHKPNSSTGETSALPRIQDWRDVYLAGANGYVYW